MRLLLVHPGAAYSTHDVWQGLRDGLTDEGHQVFEYEIAGHTMAAGIALRELHKSTGDPPPGRGAVLYHAGHPVYTMCLRHAIQAVIIVTAEHWHPDHTALIRRAGIPVGIVFTESPYQDETHACNLGLASHVWTNDKNSVPVLGEAFRNLDAPAKPYYLPLAYNPHTGDLPPMPSHDVVFVGSGFQERVELLGAVNWDGIDLGLYGEWSLIVPGALRRASERFWGDHPPFALTKAVSRLLPGGSPLWPHIRGGIISNDLALSLYRRAAIGINLFRSSVVYSNRVTTAGDAYSLSPRLYELASTGTFIVSEARPEIAEVFEDLIPTFETALELEDLIRYWLPRVEERAEVGKRLQERVREHTYRDRAKRLIADLE